MPAETAIIRRLQKIIVCTEMRFIMRQVSAHRFYRTWLLIPHFHALKPCDVLCAITGRLYSSRLQLEERKAWLCFLFVAIQTVVIDGEIEQFTEQRECRIKGVHIQAKVPLDDCVLKVFMDQSSHKFW